MARAKTFVNGGSVFPADLNAIQDDYETGYSVWKPMFERTGRLSGPASQLTYMLTSGQNFTNLVATGGALTYGGNRLFTFPNSGFDTAGGRALSCRIVAHVFVGATAPAASMLVELMRGGGGTGTTTAAGITVGASGATVTTPAINSATRVAGPAFAPGIALDWALTVTPSIATAAGSLVGIRAVLEYRYV